MMLLKLPKLKLRTTRILKLLVIVGVSDPGVRKPTSKFVTVCPCLDGLAQDGTQEGNAARVISHQGGVLVVGVTSVRERESEPVR